MRILITNDDGIYAEGLTVLEDIARSLSDDVWVVAPEKDQSGLSHSLTLSDPLRIRKIDDRHYSVRGTPTDCVIMAIKHIMLAVPDIVLSGVNSGGNIADDVTYSGTVAGAMEGTLLGVRSFALSQEYVSVDSERQIPWDTARHHAPAILQKLLTLPFKPGILTNINFPACAPNEVDGIEVARQGHLAHDIYIDERHDGRGFPYYWLRFSRNKGACAAGTDAFAVGAKKIAVTPLQLDLTAHDELKSIVKIFA